MFWIAIGIIIAGWIIGQVIREVFSEKMNANSTLERAKRKTEIDKQFPPGSDGFKLIKAYINWQVCILRNQIYYDSTHENVDETIKKEYLKLENEVNQLHKKYKELSKKLGYEATDIYTDDWPDRLQEIWNELEQKKEARKHRLQSKT
jgi:hypothetical protein